MKPVASFALALVVCALPSAAGATELFGGIYVHGVNTPLSLGGSPEGGFDAQLGFRGPPIFAGTKLEPYVFGALNSKGDTHYAAAGLAWKFGDQIYVRPGLGLAVHSGSAANFNNPDNRKIEFGSRMLFEPEIAVGARINERLSVEASWIHMSHGTLFSRQNPGIDNFGVRLNLKL